MHLESDNFQLKDNQMSFYDVRFAVLNRAVNKLSNVAMFVYDSRLVDLVMKKTEKENVNLALDVGTGQGTDAILFSKRCKDVIAVDISLNALITAKNLARCEKAIEKICLVQADAEHLPFKENTFDVVYCKDVLHHVSNSVQTVKEMNRVAQDEGFLVALEANALNPQMIVIGLIYYSIDKGVLRNTSAKLSNIFFKAGIHNVRITETECLPRHMLFEYRSPLSRFFKSGSIMLALLAIVENAWEKPSFLSKFSNYLIISGFKEHKR
jgi:ubiquinone/menaquinone biosynthesis C-methylase UbiE